MQSISDLRKEYQLKSLSETNVADSAIQQFEDWFQEAILAEIKEPNAMTLATASSDGIPSARIVLLKGLSENGFIFFTNYNSFKGQQLAENPRGCLVFFWMELERQVRITGLIDKISAQENDEYFNSRPMGSRIGAWASPQSQVIESREWLEARERDLQEQFSGKPIVRPTYWGGYRLKPISVEFWQGRPSRLHDRIQYTLEKDGNWNIERLAP